MLGGLLGLVGLSAIAGILVTATVTPAIAVSGYAASSAISLFDSLPGALQVDRPMEPTTIYAKNGGDDDGYYELASFYDQNREPVEYDEVSQTLYDAILSSEDPRYYEHGGVDLIGTTRAILSNAVSDNTQGGSSISQQYVKNVQVEACERTAEGDEERAECYNDAVVSDGTEGYKRKLQEMRYAITIEQEYSKEQILLGYLNLANFGGTTYGIEAAAKRYFSTSAKDLSLSHAATLAGIVQNPNTYRIDLEDGSTVDADGNPINSAEDGYALTLDRRNYVLTRMLNEGVITQEAYDEAYEQPIEPKLTYRDEGCAAAEGSAYFCQYVKNTILNDDRYDDAFGETDDERGDLLTRGGLEIYTTLDSDLQAQAQQTMANNVAQDVESMRLGSTTVQLDTHTGNILSMAQNTKFSETGNRVTGETSVVFAGDDDHGSSTGFSAGSTYKMFTIIDWLENGRSANEILDGRAGQSLSFTCNGAPIPSYTTNPRDNFNGDGGRVDTVRNFTGLSLNTGFYAMASQLDVCEIHGVASRMGITLGDGTPLEDFSGYTNYFSVVGSANIAPIDMAAAYAAVANGGIRCEPTAILRVVDAGGEELEMPDEQCERVLDENVAATTAYTMSRVMEPGQTGFSANVGDGIATFGKTGTHEDMQSWMVQTSTNVTTAAWVGNWTVVFPSEEDFNSNTAWWYADKVDLTTGAETPHMDNLFTRGLANLRYTISRENQAAANAKYGGDAFPEPDPNLTQVIEKSVPNVSGMSVDEATSVLNGEGFRVRVGEEIPGNQDKGLVEGTSPSGTAPAGSLVTLQISDGKGAIDVPDVTGMTPAQASRALFDEGLSPNFADNACSESNGVSRATVTRTDPGAGTQLPEGANISIYWEAPSCDGDDPDDDGDENGNGNGNNNGRGNDD